LPLDELGDGVLPWGWIDNRPWLRFLNGYGLCLWRLGNFKEAEHVFDRVLWLNPTDNQGVRFNIEAVRSERNGHLNDATGQPPIEQRASQRN
jgi:tetratricopeptide (TPR) repeat protein